MACRFPGDLDSPEKFWNFIADGREAISEIPEERWSSYLTASPENAAVLRRTTRWGGFLSDIKGFDAEFFGISPREAELMDPQQRILLEVAWEALEHAGIPPRELAGTDTGVFVGVGSDDYGRRLLEDIPRVEAWTGIGGAFCAVANRISYTLDLRGPSLAVDTACSASLVAIHLACQSLRLREAPVAIAGGVLVMAGPGLTVVLDAAGATAPDGRSKSFDASADGYGRGEGAGLVVLKRLDDAVRDGDRILGLIRGSAVHQDGKTNGIMAPSQEAQEHLMRRTYRAAGLSPDTVDYVEAHGTGTRMGDPLEAGALAAVFGADRPADRPCLIGSVKPNIGHLEAGAGIASVIKTVLALRYAELPPNRNLHELNPAIPWNESGLRVVTERTPWPASTHPRRAGVSGFGYGGTIAHLILDQAPESPAEKTAGQDNAAISVLPISGVHEAGVRDYADRLATWLAGPGAEVPLASVEHTLTARRSQLGNRAAVTGHDRPELIDALRRLAAGEPAPEVTTGTAPHGDPARLVWVFSGHGSQWSGMGRELLVKEPAFAEVIDAIDPIFRQEIGFSPRRVLEEGDLGGVDQIQPLIFTMQVGLAAVWRRNGVRPDAVIGHSVGEIAAAVTAGVFTLEEGARLVCRRSLLLRRAAGNGAMIMVNLPFDEAKRRLGTLDSAVAAISASPTSTVIAGDIPAVAVLAELWRTEDLMVRRVDSDVAFHSHHMDPLLADLAAAAGDLNPVAPTVRLYSTALEDPRSTAPRDGRYWATNLRQPVRFAAAITAAVEDGYRAFVEVSAHPVVAHSITETLADLGAEDCFVAHSLRRGKPEVETLTANLAGLHCDGVAIDWTARRGGELVDLPTTAWQHRPFWASSGSRVRQGGQHDVESHTLLGARTPINGTTSIQLWQSYLDMTCRPYPGDHPVQGVEIIPAAVLLNTFLAATDGTIGDCALDDVHLRVPVAAASPRELQVIRQDGVVRLASRLLEDEAADGETDGSWLTHTTATVAPGVRLAERKVSLARARRRCGEHLDPRFVIERLASVGVAAMGFPWVIEDMRRGDGELLALVRTSPDPDTAPTSWASALDAALSIASVVFAGSPTLRMPAHIRRVTLADVPEPPSRVVVAVRVADGSAGTDTVDVDITTEDGTVVASFAGLRYGVLDGDPGAATSPRRLVHEIAYRPLELAESTTGPALVAIVGDDAGLADRFAAAGVRTLTYDAPERLDAARDQLVPGSVVLASPAAIHDGETVYDAAARAAWLVTRTARWLATAGLATSPRLWCLTRGVLESVDTAALGQAPLWGLGRVVAGEHPEFWGGLVDVPAEFPDDAVDPLLRAMAASPGEDVIVVRDGAPRVARLTAVERSMERPPTECRPDGTYLVTGGLGVLGLEVARWLAGRGARRLVLAGRHALPAREAWGGVTDDETRRQIEAVRALEALGVTVRTVALDVANRDEVAKLLSPDELGLPPVRGIVHAAGVLDNRMLGDVDEESLRTVMRPKVAGAWVLHELFPPGSLDFFVLFSSCGLLLGLTGQTTYASANAFMDALAAHRRVGGHSDTVSFGWTSWRGLGMSTSSAVIDAELATHGTADITAAEAFRCWEFAERHDAAYVAVLRTIPLEPGASRLPLLSELAVAEAAEPRSGTGDAEWRSLPPDELRAYVVEEVRRHVAGEMKLTPGELDIRRPLAELGLDSVMTVVIRRRLERSFHLSLPATLLWQHPSAGAIGEFIAGQLDGTPATAPYTDADVAPETPVATVG
jgi:6-methylsalicylic acid synthase